MQAPPSPSVMDSECAQYTHNKLEFLKDGKRKDKQGRLNTDPEYDCRSLLVSLDRVYIRYNDSSSSNA